MFLRMCRMFRDDRQRRAFSVRGDKHVQQPVGHALDSMSDRRE